MQRRNFLMGALALLALPACQKQRVGSVVAADLEPLLRPPGAAYESAGVLAARPATVKVSAFGGDLMAAIQSLPADGGVVAVDQTIYLMSTVDVPRGVELVGTVALPGNNSAGNTGVDHLQQRHILVARGVSLALRLHGAAGINGVFLHKEGVLFGDSSAVMFADEAVHLVGEDAYVEGCFITGFQQAIYGHFVQRSRIINNRLDCINGVWLEKVFDIARVYSNHAWPFVTVAVGTPDSAWREGTAFRFSDGGDWNHLTGNFCFGYAKGYWLHNVEHVTAVQCGADSFGSHRMGIGFHVSGNSKNIALLACQAAAQRIGFYNETSPKDKPDQMIGCSHWANVADVVGWDS